MGKQKLIIHKPFGPLQPMELEIDDVMVFIGEQATGKSTVAKLIYFFKSLSKESFSSFFNTPHSEIFDKFSKTIGRNFFELFGNPKKLPPVELTYCYSKDDLVLINIKSLNGILKVNFSEDLHKGVFEALKKFSDTDPKPYFDDIEQKIFQTNYSELVFIPAARGLTTTYGNSFLFEIYGKQQSERNLMGQIFEHFIQRMDVLRKAFRGKSINDLIFERKEFFSDANEKNSELAKNLFKTILKGEYKLNGDGERITFGETENDYVFLDNASSGQQEVIRILQDLFLMILNKEKVYLIIEEPEAHLYPTAQKHLMELIALMVNATGNQVFITTHSPYILTSFNNLLYAHRMGQKKEKEAAEIIPKSLWLNPEKFHAYRLQRTGGKFCKSIFNKKYGVIGYNELDDVSEDLAGEFDALLKLNDDD